MTTFGRLLCWLNLHRTGEIAIKWQKGGPSLTWPGCHRCHKVQHPDILARRGEGYEVDWTEQSRGPTWGYPVK